MEMGSDGLQHRGKSSYTHPYLVAVSLLLLVIDPVRAAEAEKNDAVLSLPSSRAAALDSCLRGR
jgi:hypothetical protein